MSTETVIGGLDWSADLGELTSGVQASLAALDDRRFMERLWAKEPDLWRPAGSDQSEIVDRLGWLDVATAARAQLPSLTAFADSVRAAGFRQVLLLGMGGSSLAPEVLQMVFGTAPGYLDLRILDSTHPDSVRQAEAWLDLERALFLVSSKSGGTIEVLSFYRYFRSRLEEKVGIRAGQHFVAVTDPGTSLERLAAESDFRQTFLNPPDIGGRYSVLSNFGLLPAALLGLDLERLLDSALAMQAACGPQVPALANPGAGLGVILGEMARHGRDKLTLITSPAIAPLGAWAEQLIAESTGKEGTGIVPIDGEPLGDPSLYGRDRLFVHLRVADDTGSDAAILALLATGQPVVQINLPDRYALGAEFYRWEMATAVAGSLLGINAFDQPNVQESKDFTGRFLSEYQREGRLPDSPATSPGPQLAPALARLLSEIKPGDYLALNAYLVPDQATRTALEALRRRLRDHYKIATTIGFGPRFLHSTGQLHKGGPASGLFLQLTGAIGDDLAIPGQPYGFGTLVAAQALGDWEALASRKRRALRIHLPVDTVAGLNALARTLTALI